MFKMPTFETFLPRNISKYYSKKVMEITKTSLTYISVDEIWSNKSNGKVISHFKLIFNVLLDLGNLKRKW